VLPLIALASALEGHTVIEGAVGAEYLPSPSDVVNPRWSTAVRAAAGWGRGPVDVYALVDAAVFSALPAEYQLYDGRYILSGDGRITLVGPGVRWRLVDTGPTWVAGRLEVCVAFFDSPVDEDAFAADVLWSDGFGSGMPPHVVSIAVQPGAEFGVALLDGVYAVGSVDVTGMGFSQLHFRVTPRLGLLVSF
jgi:hypothetical protein